MSRANGGDLLFRDDVDRRRFLGLLSELPDRFSPELPAFVLMAGSQLRRGGARHPQVLEAGTEQPGDAGLRRGPARTIVKWTYLAPLPPSTRFSPTCIHPFSVIANKAIGDRTEPIPRRRRRPCGLGRKSGRRRGI
jgi:hypothetical protein